MLYKDKLASKLDAGEKLLDTHDPDWAKKIDLDRFNMKSHEDDILGQLFGGYADGLEKLGVPLFTTDDVKLGFDITTDDISDAAYKTLTEEWIKRVRNRL